MSLAISSPAAFFFEFEYAQQVKGQYAAPKVHGQDVQPGNEFAAAARTLALHRAIKIPLALGEIDFDILGDLLEKNRDMKLPFPGIG